MKRNPRRDILIGLAASVFGNFTPASTTATTTPGPWDLYSGTSKVSTHPSEAACVAAAVTRGVARAYTCRTRTGVTVTVVADPPTCTAAKPADELRAVICPNTDTKWWNQERTWVAAPYPTCWTATEWAPSAPNALECVPDQPDPTPDPPVGSDVITVNEGESISAAVAKLEPGGSVVVKPGKYAAFNLKACTAEKWCRIAAETPGTVTVAGLNIGPGNWYTALVGFKFAGSAGKQINGGFVKLVNTAIEGGPASGNSATLTIGSNNRTPGANDILLENVWVYGPGGRYKVLVYNAHRVVLRRVVVRHDGGWTYDGQNPQGGFSLYDSKDVACQNCMFVDSVQSLAGFEAALYLVSNGTTSTKQSNVTVTGSILVGSPNNGLAAEGQSAASYTVSDLVVTGSKQGAVNTNGAAHTLTVNGLTANVAGTAIARWASSGSLKVTNCKIVKGTASSGATLSNCPGGTGATLQRIGVDGTMFGEAGFDQPRGELWPWPNEARIKADFDSVRAAFGGKTLSEYARQ